MAHTNGVPRPICYATYVRKGVKPDKKKGIEGTPDKKFQCGGVVNLSDGKCRRCGSQYSVSFTPNKGKGRGGRSLGAAA